jgi:lysozyme
MTAGAAAREIIKRPGHEGPILLKAKKCPAGYWTAGYGHTSGVTQDTACTPELAEDWLTADLAYVDGLIAKHVEVSLNQNQYDALASLIFNVGPGKKGAKDGIVELATGGSSTLLRLLNAGDYTGAANQFTRWVYASVDGRNQKLPGLITRRFAERELFLKSVETPRDETAA